MIVVADAGPLIHLSLIGKVELLPALFGRILIAERVYAEVVQEGDTLPGSAELRAANWVDRGEDMPQGDVLELLNAQLDAGETAALWLAIAREADWVLTDDRQARLAAERLGFQVKGTLGILVEAKRKGLISSLAPLVHQLKANGVWLSNPLIERTLEEVGES